MSGELGALPPLQQWAAQYEALVRGVAAAYPRAAIISLVYPLELQLVGVRTQQQTLAYLQHMAAAGSRFQAAGLRNVYTLQARARPRGRSRRPLAGACQECCAPRRAPPVRLPLAHPLAYALSPPAVQLDGLALPNTNWCRAHPDAATHALIAEQLVAFVRRVVPGWARP